MPRTLLLTSLTLSCCGALSWVRFDAPPPNAAKAQRYPLYPLRATYMPCGSVELRNTEPRNVRMCKETEYFVASLLNADGASCAEVGTLLRIDGVENATRDNTGQVLARPRDAPRALRTCDVRDAWRARLRRKAASPMSPTRLERSASTSNGGGDHVSPTRLRRSATVSF